MYVYFNEQGILTTQILHGDSPVRQGSSFDIYILFETTQKLDDKVLSIQFRRPGEQTFGTEYFLTTDYIDEIEFKKINDKEITYDLIDGKKYKAYKFTADSNTYVTAKFGNAEALVTIYQETDLENEPSEDYQTIREIYTNGLINFYIEKTFGKTAAPTISDEQYNYLISYVGTLLNAVNNVKRSQNLVNVYPTESDLVDIDITNFGQGYKVQILADSLHDNMSTVYQLNSDKEWEYYGTYNEILVEEISNKLDKNGGTIEGNLEIAGNNPLSLTGMLSDYNVFFGKNIGGIYYLMAITSKNDSNDIIFAIDCKGICTYEKFEVLNLVDKMDLKTQIDNKLPLTGGTLTGLLEANGGIKINKDFGIINSETNDGILFAPDGSLILNNQTKGLVLSLLNEPATMEVRNYTFPDKDGEVVLKEDFKKFVTLEGNQTITGQKTFKSTVITPQVRTQLGMVGSDGAFGIAFDSSGVPYIKTNGLVLQLHNSASGGVVKKYTFPDKDGEVVLSSTLSNYVTQDNINNFVNVSEGDLDDIINEVYGGN